MSKNKLYKFEENKTFENLFQHTDYAIREGEFPLKGHWQDYFKNGNPVILEVGCGKGEYTIALAERFPDVNFIGVDRKGARLWRGCKTAIENDMPNVAFIRAKVEDITCFFAENEVSEIWVTFPDPQPVKPRKRLISPNFVDRYKKFLVKDGKIHLKTDSRLLYDYILETAKEQHWKVEENIEDIYNRQPVDPILTEIKTFYEKIWLNEGLMISYVRLSV